MTTSPDRTRRSGGHARSGPLLRTRDVDAAPPRHRAPVATSSQGTRARPRPRPRGRVVLAAGAAGVVVLLVGGAALLADRDGPPASGPRASADASSGATSEAELSPSVIAATAAGRTPAQARTALQEQLSARADANLALLRSTWASDEAASARAAEALSRTSEGFAAVVAAWEDRALATRLRAGLDEQSQASRDYATAVAASDTVSADWARGRMAEVSRGLGAELARLTRGGIASHVPPQDAAKYRMFVDALEAGDAAAADATAKWLRARLGREGVALADALAGGGRS
jgi:hypothetical protein